MQNFIINWDADSKAFPYRVLTDYGQCIGYFRTAADAAAWCEA